MATNKTFDETQGFKDCISSNLPPRAMRYSMENKNNLEKRGSIYVGLGTKRNTTINVGTIDAIFLEDDLLIVVITATAISAKIPITVKITIWFLYLTFHLN